MEKRVHFDKDGSVGFIILDDGKVNSYDIDTMKQLNTVIDQNINDEEIKVVIMKSGSAKLFSAGANIKKFIENLDDLEANLDMINYAHKTLSKMADSGKIFVAMINGGAFGGGLEMTLACDFRFAAEGEYRMGLPEVTLGLLPGNGGTVRLPRLIGCQKSLDMMVTGRVVNPQTALEYGIVDKLFPIDKLEEETIKWAKRVSSQASMAIANIKNSVYQGLNMSLSDALSNEREHMRPLFGSHDAKEGLTAFVEKRRADFKGE